MRRRYPRLELRELRWRLRLLDAVDVGMIWTALMTSVGLCRLLEDGCETIIEVADGFTDNIYRRVCQGG